MVVTGIVNEHLQLRARGKVDPLLVKGAGTLFRRDLRLLDLFNNWLVDFQLGATCQIHGPDGDLVVEGSEVAELV